jgi:hypothetical protein
MVTLKSIDPVESPTIYGGDEEKMFISYSCLPAGREGGVQNLALSNGVDLSILPQKNLLSWSLKGSVTHGKDR